jgi:hypothetical protein
MRAIPHGLEDGVRHSQADQVLDRRHSEHVIDTKEIDVAGRAERARGQCVEPPCAPQISPKRLFDHDPAPQR